MAECNSEFEKWLSLQLKLLNMDEGVYCSYIIGIMSSDETIDEKTESLEGIFSDIKDIDIGKQCSTIIEKWKDLQQNTTQEKIQEVKEIVNVEDKLVKLMETNVHTTVVQREHTEEEKKIRAAILAQYADTSDKELSEDEEVDEKTLMKNTNAAAIAQAEKEKRDKAKLESQKKKEKDKEDREKQKQQQQDKKEKRKTQKQERRR